MNTTMSMPTVTGATPSVSLRNLQVRFVAQGKVIHAVNGVDLEVGRGEVVALLGESGSGKSVTLRSIMRLHPERSTLIEGVLEVEGEDVLAMSRGQLADWRGKVVSMVFQEPLLALDPVYTVGAQIVEMMRRHQRVSRSEARQRALSLFEKVRIPSPERRLDAYPHEMSGGMRQRAMIALALSCEPRVLLADEPTTALDATVQIQILLLLRELQEEFNLSIVFVTHDIGAATEVADRIAVMYAGQIVEQGPALTMLTAPRHPYTIALLRSRAHGAMKKGEPLETIGGAPPDLADLSPGCSFAPRCAHATVHCLHTQPLEQFVGTAHSVRCVRVDELSAAINAVDVP